MNWRDVAGVGPRSWSFIIAYVPIATMKVHLAMAAPGGAALMLNEEHRRTHELPSSPARPVASGRPLWLDDHDLAVDAFATMIAHRWDANRVHLASAVEFELVSSLVVAGSGLGLVASAPYRPGQR